MPANVKHNKQTISYLSRRFSEVGLTPNRRHGQNFLIDFNLIELLARTADIQKNDVVLEVGTGVGSLTGLLAPLAARIVTVEIDQHLFQLAAEELAEFENIEMIHQDVLKSKNRIDRNILEAVQSAMGQVENSRLKLAANLPYNIATPLISNLLLWDIVPATMTVTIQKELADRILAKPSTKDYGALSVWIQSLCDVTLIRVLHPSVFWPRPKVESAIIHIVTRAERRQQFADLKFFHEFVRSMFFHRRKFLRSVAISAFKGRLDKPAVDRVLTTAQLGRQARTEQLTVEQLQDLCELFRNAILNLANDD